MAVIVTVTPNPVLDRTLTVPRIVFNEVMRATSSRLDWGGKGFSLKGDVNYRRLLDDRHWPHTMCVEKIAAYFPASFLVLRTLKGEIMVGLEAGQAEALAAEDSTWLINGKRGIIQLVSQSGGRCRLSSGTSRG